jgi:hypothetical protein
MRFHPQEGCCALLKAGVPHHGSILTLRDCSAHTHHTENTEGHSLSYTCHHELKSLFVPRVSAAT